MRTPYRIFLLCLAALISSASPTRAWEDASPSVPIEDTIYDDLEVLSAHGLIDGLIAGQRPWTRAEIARLIHGARIKFMLALPEGGNNVSRSPQEEYILKLLTHLETAYPAALNVLPTRRLEFGLLEKATLDALILNSPSRPYFGNGVDANYNPLVENHGGRHLVEGFQTAIESEHSVKFGRHLAGFIKPRFQLQFYNAAGPQEYAAFLQEAYATVSFFNTALDLGRKPLHWGQSRFGGMMFSANARAFDGAQIGNPEPWKIKFLGRLKYTFFFGGLGPEQNFSGAQISGGKISLMPAKWFEFGASRAIIFGGTGAPAASTWDIFKEFFGARNNEEFLVGGGPNLSNSISGFEWRARLPFWHGINVYNEIYFEDFTIEKAFTSLRQDTAILAGVEIPRLDDKGTLSLRVEGRKTSDLMYRHSAWISGWALNGFIMGDPMGAQGESLTIGVTKVLDDFRTRFSGTLSLGRHDGDLYGAPAGGARFVLVDGPAELRVRGVAGASHRLNARFGGTASIGYERVENFNFVSGASENNFLIQAAVTFTPNWTIRK